jgi:hypothetical protein
MTLFYAVHARISSNHRQGRKILSAAVIPLDEAGPGALARPHSLDTVSSEDF